MCCVGKKKEKKKKLKGNRKGTGKNDIRLNFKRFLACLLFESYHYWFHKTWYTLGIST